LFKRSRVEITVPAGEVLLEVAERVGIKLASLCRGGTCGTCRVRLISGSPAVQTTKALNSQQKQAGWLLTCSARTVAGQRIVLDA
jgi:ferredoxin